MQKYKPKKPLASAADRILRLMIACGLGISWFVYLWGLSLPALTAGIGMGGLLWLCVRQFGKQSTMKREKQMRRMIGGELALKKLLLLPPRHAAFQTALWIAPKFPVTMHKAVDWGVTGTLNGKQTLIHLIAQHESMPVTVQQIVETVREMHQRQMQQCILCLTAPASKEAIAFAESSEISIQIVHRQELIDLAGLCSPATDEELSKLSQKKRMKRSLHEWIKLVLDASRARRYFWYGLGMSVLALVTGQAFYPLPAAVCLVLYVLCKLRVAFRRPRSIT